MSKFKHSYQAFLFFPILYEEIQLPTGSDIAKLDAIAEIVTDCSGQWLPKIRDMTQYPTIAMLELHSRNAHGPGQVGCSAIPTYAILCNPYLNQSKVPTVRFIKFEGASRSFFVGAEARKNSQTEVYGLYQSDVDPFMFMKSLRGICDIIFDLLLLGFIDSMKASRGLRFAFGKFDYAEEDAEKWDVSINHAEIALKKFREAAEQYQNGRLGCCDDTVEEGMQALNTA